METKTWLILGGVGVAGYLAYEYFSTPVVAPPATTTSIAAPPVNTPTQTPTVPIARPDPTNIVYQGTSTTTARGAPVVGRTIAPVTPTPVATAVTVTAGARAPTRTSTSVTSVAPPPSTALINGRWSPADWNTYMGLVDPTTVSTSMIHNSRGMSLNDANDFIADLIANTAGASARLDYNFAKITQGKLLALNPGMTALMFNGTFKNPNDAGLSAIGVSDIEAWLTGSMFAGIPNWIVVIGGLVVLKGIVK